jgi:hypothetical protein
MVPRLLFRQPFLTRPQTQGLLSGTKQGPGPLDHAIIAVSLSGQALAHMPSLAMAGILCVVFVHFVQIFTNCPLPLAGRWNGSIDDDPFGDEW